jgi:outer membrane protein assembly factor BamD (BamD/ComL family)
MKLPEIVKQQQNILQLFWQSSDLRQKEEKEIDIKKKTDLEHTNKVFQQEQNNAHEQWQQEQNVAEVDRMNKVSHAEQLINKVNAAFSKTNESINNISVNVSINKINPIIDNLGDDDAGKMLSASAQKTLKLSDEIEDLIKQLEYIQHEKQVELERKRLKQVWIRQNITIACVVVFLIMVISLVVYLDRKAYQRKQNTLAAEIFTKATASELEKKYTIASDAYNEMIAKYPKSPLVEDAKRKLRELDPLVTKEQYENATQMEVDGKYKEAFTLYNAFLARYPKSPFTDRAKKHVRHLAQQLAEENIRKAEELESQGRNIEALNRYQEVLTNYGSGSLTDTVKDKIINLQNILPKYWIKMSNIDDIGTAYVNGEKVLEIKWGIGPNGSSVGNRPGYSDWVEITPYIRSGKNTLRFTLWNAAIVGGWCYKFELKKENNIIYNKSDGRNRDSSQGIKFDDTIEINNELQPINTNISQQIPKDAMQWNNHWYKIFNDIVLWHEAKAICESLGGHLAIIDNKEENDFISGLVNRIGGDITWIGANDIEKHGTWVWDNGKQVTFFNWDNGQPNGTEEIYLGINKQGKWHDCDATAKFPFICEWE